MLSLFSASNHLPEDETLRALFDRFLLRCHVDNLRREAMPRLLAAGWEMERFQGANASISAADLRSLSARIYQVDLTKIAEPYSELVFKVRDLGVALSDRRAVKVLKLVAASAVLCGRPSALVSDFWPLRYVWDREEQIGPLASLVGAVLEPHAGEERAHPLAIVPERIDGEEIARQLDTIGGEIQRGSISLAMVARLREQVADLADRAAWLADESARRHLLEQTAQLLGRLG
jgi:MoxR-like ATPase